MKSNITKDIIIHKINNR